MEYYPGIEIKTKEDSLGFVYGENVYGPVPEIRRLEEIRQSLEEPDCCGPEELYAISMDSPGSIVVDDADPRIEFSANWRRGGVHQEFNSTASISSTAGAAFKFIFNGELVLGLS